MHDMIYCLELSYLYHGRAVNRGKHIPLMLMSPEMPVIRICLGKQISLGKMCSGHLFSGETPLYQWLMVGVNESECSKLDYD